LRAAAQVSGIDAAQVEAIKNVTAQKQKFLAELIEHVTRWELEGSELRLYFPAESRTLADLMQAREPLEKLRTIVNEVTHSALRVCVKLESSQGIETGRAARGTQVSRAQFEQDPIVRAMLDRFGGQITEVKRRGEG
jgi:uncharacterized protein (UPF0216 family)